MHITDGWGKDDKMKREKNKNKMIINQLQQNIFLFISLVSSSIITFRWSSKEGSKGFQTAGGDGGLGGSLLCAAWCKEEKTQDKSQPDGGSACWEGSWEKSIRY